MKTRKRLGRLAALIFLILMFAGIGAGLQSCSSSDLPDALNEFADLSKVQLPDQANPSRIYSADGVELGQINVENRSFVALDEMADCVPEAFVAIEDERFYKHGGVDARGVLRAIWRAISRGKAKEGASTITMQLARNLYLSPEKTLKRKANEALIASELERKYSKDEILEAYLNVIYFGHGAYGVGAASDLFFGKPAHKLETHECALLAAVVKGPAVYSPYINAEKALERRNLVLKKMEDNGSLDARGRALAKKQPLRVKSYSGPYENFLAPYFVDYVIHRLTSDNGPFGFSPRDLATGGYQIYTTLDWGTQQDAEASVRGAATAAGIMVLPKRGKQADAALQYARYTDVKLLGLDPADAAQRYKKSGLSGDALRAVREQAAAGAPQGAFVALDAHTGAVLAMVGGMDSKASRYNRAWLSARQPGSSFKPFVYLTALMQDHTMMETVENSRYCIGDYCPKNYGGNYGDGAMVTWHHALVKSLNIPAVRVGHAAGERSIISLCRNLGLDGDMEATAPLSLGAASASPLQMAAAYAAIANGGHRVRPFAVSVIRDSEGTVIFRRDPEPGPLVLAPRALAGLIPAMEDVIRVGTGKSARIGRIAAGKTGTTSGYRDAWFVGFTPDVAAAAWLGYDNNAPLCPPESSRGCITGGSLPAAMWRDVLKNVKPLRHDFNLAQAAAPEIIANPDDVELTNDIESEDSGTATPTVIIDIQNVEDTPDETEPMDTAAPIPPEIDPSQPEQPDIPEPGPDTPEPALQDDSREAPE